MEFDDLRHTIHELMDDFKSRMLSRAHRLRERRGSGRAEGAPPPSPAATSAAAAHSPPSRARPSGKVPHTRSPIELQTEPTHGEKSAAAEERKQAGDISAAISPGRDPVRERISPAHQQQKQQKPQQQQTHHSMSHVAAAPGEEVDQSDRLEVDLEWSEDELQPRHADSTPPPVLNAASAAAESERKSFEPRVDANKPKASRGLASRQHELTERLATPSSARHCSRHTQPRKQQTTSAELQEPSTLRKEGHSQPQPEVQQQTSHRRGGKKKGSEKTPTCKVLDFVSYPTCYQLLLFLPSFQKQHISVTLTASRCLLIRAEREEEQRTENTDGSGHYKLHIDRALHVVERSIALPWDADDTPGVIRAKFDHSVLQLLLPKRPQQSDDQPQAAIPLS